MSAQTVAGQGELERKLTLQTGNASAMGRNERLEQNWVAKRIINAQWAATAASRGGWLEEKEVAAKVGKT